MKNKPALLLYFIACAVFMLAIVLNNSELMLVAKPIIVPAIFFYYLQEKNRINWSYVVIVMLFFVGDMIVLIDIPDLFVLIVAVFQIAYLFFLKGLVDDLAVIRLRFINKTHLFALLICIFFLIYLLISIIDVLLEAKTENMYLMVFYGITLVAIGTIASLNYIIKPSRYTTFMIFASLAFVFSDIFYILKKDFLEIEILNYLNNFMQIISYYYLTKYYLLKDSKNEI